MAGTLAWLWDVCFVGLLLFVAAVPVSALAGPEVALTIWMVGIAAYQPLAWSSFRSAGLSRFASWAAGTLAGILCFLALRTAVGHVVAGIVGTLAAASATLACVRGLGATGATAPAHAGPASRSEARSWPARESKWLLASLFATLLFMLVVVSIWGDAAPDLDPAAAAGLSATTYVASALVRASYWLSRPPGRRYAPDALAVLGVCLLAYGGLGTFAEGEEASSNRYLATLGAGLAGVGIAVRLRTPAPRS